ncbi:MAG: nucleotidyltransferase substrate binding protein [Cyanobacteria bacterium J06573_11]
MTDPDIRWIQRYANFESAFLLLNEALRIKDPSVVERAGLIQFFEMAFELSWKIMKDYKQAEGVKARTPREVLKQAFQIGLIKDGHTWLDALDDRNLTAHTYKEDVAKTVENRVRERYYGIIATLYETLRAKKEAAERTDAEQKDLKQ